MTYADPRPASKIGKVRVALMYLMDEHRRDDALPTSVRFLFYELVMRRIIAKDGNRPDKIVSEALTDLRERGLSAGRTSSTKRAPSRISAARRPSPKIG
jgi:hypothetical protein